MNPKLHQLITQFIHNNGRPPTIAEVRVLIIQSTQ